MERRNLGAGLLVLASSLLLLVGTASAHGTVGSAGLPAHSGTCHIRSLPSFIAQGEFSTAATVGDVIEISCDPFTYSAGAEVTLVASQLYSRCHEISWYDPNDQGDYDHSTGRTFTVHLDVNGNANVALIAGPNCMVGESLISVDENESPYETFTTSFQVLPSVNTPPGLYITPAAQVEDAESSGVITIAQAEFKRASEQYVRLGYEQLTDRCEANDHNILVEMNRNEETNTEEDLGAIRLDNNGNGFAVLIGSDSCAEGLSLIESDLEASPFTTQTGTFLVEPPRPERF
jgi:hypothetical protein